MKRKALVYRVPAAALEEFEEVERRDWTEGLTLDELVEWVNVVAARFRPDEVGDDSRASRNLTPRTLRHYQTLGCIDMPARRGRRAVYRFRHYVQALLLRKLVWERMPSERIAALMAGRATEELKRLLFEGIEVIARGTPAEPPSGGEMWFRIRIAPGVELAMQDGMENPGETALRGWMERVESSLRARFRGE